MFSLEKFILHGKGTVRACVLSSVQLFPTPWTVARQASLSMGFPRREYWSPLTFPSPSDDPDSGVELKSCIA